MNVNFDTGLKGKEVQVRCTWTAGYAEPKVNKGLRVISYNKNEKLFPKVIGTLTGNYTQDNKGVFWVEAFPAKCNRIKKLWFRANDVAPDLELTGSAQTKKTNWLWWIAAGLMALKGL